MIDDAVAILLDYYPKIYFACHTKHVRDAAKNVTLTSHQASILDHLTEDEPIGLYDLATHMGVTPSTMSLLINRLVNLGYVRREKDRLDSRKLNLTLTPAGAKIKRTNSVLDSQRVKAMLQRLSAAEVDAALKGLRLLGYAAEMEMKSKSLNKSWNQRSSKKTRKESL